MSLICWNQCGGSKIKCGLWYTQLLTTCDKRCHKCWRTYWDRTRSIVSHVSSTSLLYDGEHLRSSLVLQYCTLMSRWRKLLEQLCSSRWGNYFGETSKAVKTLKQRWKFCAYYTCKDHKRMSKKSLQTKFTFHSGNFDFCQW